MKIFNKILLIVGLATPFFVNAQYFSNRYLIDSSSAATGFNAIENDSGYLMVGGYAPFGYYASIAVIQTDFNGTELFQKIYKTNTVPYYAGSKGSLQKVSGDGYIMYGSTYNGSKIRDLLYRFNDVGDTLWTRQLSDTTYDYIGRQVKETSDGGFICIGDRGVSFAPIFIIKTDSLGNKQWEKFYGGSQYDLPTSIALCNDGGYIYCTTTKSGGVGLPTYYNIRVMKVDSLGNMVFNKFYGDLYNEDAGEIIQTQDGGYVIACSYAISTSIIYPTLIKLNSIGDTLWLKKIIPFTGSGDGSFESVLELNDGSLVTAGLNWFTDSVTFGRDRGLVAKITATGDLVWQREHDLSTCNNCSSYLYDIRTTSDGGFICSGVAQSPQDMWLLKLDSLGCADTACALGTGILPTPSLWEGVGRIYPNPASSFITVELQDLISTVQFKLFDLTGKQVLTQQINTFYTPINIQALPKGIYFYVVTNEKERYSGKLVVN